MNPPNQTDLVARAEKLATDHHRGQTDKADQPYIDHPRRVAQRVSGFGPEFEAAAWLHDVVEDTTVTMDDLRRQFPDAVVEAVAALTKEKGSSDHAAAVARACADPIAKVVKAADVADNSDPARLALVAEPKRSELTDKYRRARQLLDEQGAPRFD